MTDITELAQSLKAAAEKATPGSWRAFQYYSGRCGISGGRNAEIMVCEHISKERPEDAVFIALANPANILALVEALEKAQRAQPCEHSMFWDASGVKRCSKCDMPEHANVHYADSAEMEIAELRQRIAELVEALEKGQQHETQASEMAVQLSTRLTAAEKRAIELDAELEREREKSRRVMSRIAELEEAEQQLCAANVTLDARAELAERQLAELESRTVTVKLPQAVSAGGQGYQEKVERILTAAGIKWEDE
ncbi:ead/Ea22-like family protein [Klebsiella aerogenes]|uniref:ead/Ea22-like family protein n=1 Tax=Klebsiella aerogenes TaxID=548 RepID=UPI003A93336B